MEPADGPGDAGVAVRVPSVQFVFVVEIDRDLHRIVGGFRPLQDLLAPVHAHVSMHLSRFHHFHLCRIPERIVRFSLLELLQRI